MPTRSASVAESAYPLINRKVSLITAAARLLRENITLWGAQNALLLHDDAFRYLQRETVGFDLIFLDPPFRQNLLVPVLEAIVDKGLLKTGGMIYLEQEADTTIIPPSFTACLALSMDFCA